MGCWLSLVPIASDQLVFFSPTRAQLANMFANHPPPSCLPTLPPPRNILGSVHVAGNIRFFPFFAALAWKKPKPGRRHPLARKPGLGAARLVRNSALCVCLSVSLSLLQAPDTHARKWLCFSETKREVGGGKRVKL